MSDLKLPRTSLTIERKATNMGDQLVAHEIMETEVPMSQEQQDAYQQIIGDANANVTVSRDASFKDYGNGGSVFVSVGGVCHQSEQHIRYAAELFKTIAEDLAEKHLLEWRNKLVQLGLVKP